MSGERAKRRAEKNARVRKAKSGPGFFSQLLGTTWLGLKLLLGVVVVLGSSAGVAWGAHRYATTSPRFAIAELEILGTKRLTPAQVSATANVKVGDNIFALDRTEAGRKILEDPWVSQVQVTRQLPGKVTIEVVEHEAAAVVAIDDELFLLTRQGLPFKALAGSDPFDLPVVTGVSGERLATDRGRELLRLGTAMEVLRHYEKLPLAKVQPAQSVHLGADGQVTLTVGQKGIALRLGRGPWRKKLLMAARTLGRLAMKGQLPGIVFLDNEAHPERVVVRMR